MQIIFNNAATITFCPAHFVLFAGFLAASEIRQKGFYEQFAREGAMLGTDEDIEIIWDEIFNGEKPL